MLLSHSDQIENFIVSYLAAHRSLPAARLHQLINQEHREVSLQAVYKELRKLIAGGVVWKQASGYSLSASWVLNFSQLADTMYHTLTESGLFEDVVPVSGEKARYQFSNLVRLDDFWINSLIMMVERSKEKKMYQWLPHPWFNLIQNWKSMPFQNALLLSGGFVQSIIGGTNFLDKQASLLTTKGVYEFSYSPGPYDERQSTYLSVTDTYLQTVELDPTKVKVIEDIYTSVQSAEDFDAAEILRRLVLPCKVTLTIDTNPRKVKRVYRKLRDYFEV